LVVARASRPWIFSAVVTTLLLLPTPAESSPSAEPPTELPVLDITADPLGRDDPAFRPFVIARGDRADHAFTTFKDALGAVPGLILQDSFGGFEPPRISLRGSGLQSAPSSRGVQLLLDGYPLSLADGSFNTALIDPQLFGRTEVVRGATAGRVAPAALGGAILLRSSSPPSGTGILPVDSLRIEASSFGGERLRLSRSSVLAGTAIQAVASLAHLHGFRDHSAQDRAAFFGKASRPARPNKSFPCQARYGRFGYARARTRTEFWPPKPKLLVSA
jgi:iron complex outermembrane receptor protein